MKLGRHHITLRPLVLPLAAAAIAAAFVSHETWGKLQTGILVVLSVVSAAVLVRLARGLPFSNPDHFKLGELKIIAGAIHSNAQALRWLIFICWGTMGLLITYSAAPLEQLPILPWALQTVTRAGSAFVGFLLGFVIARITQVIESDLSLIVLQSQVLANVISRKNAEKYEAESSLNGDTPIAGSEKFGTSIQ